MVGIRGHSFAPIKGGWLSVVDDGYRLLQTVPGSKLSQYTRSHKGSVYLQCLEQSVGLHFPPRQKKTLPLHLRTVLIQQHFYSLAISN